MNGLVYGYISWTVFGCSVATAHVLRRFWGWDNLGINVFPLINFKWQVIVYQLVLK